MASRSNLAALAALAAAACSGAQAAPAPFASPGAPSARLEHGHDVVLSWKPRAREPGGYWVEFATPGADFVKLAAVWPGDPSFRHEDLAGDTTFLYRVVPFFGAPSAAVEVVAAAGDPGTLAEGPLDDEPHAPATLASLRDVRGLVRAAPAGLVARRSSPASVELRWTDRAGDEDGYLVELAPAAHPDDFSVCALLPADARSFRKVGLAPGGWRLRVRAFFYGAPSGVATARTSRDRD
jgi:hypothetical protein